MQRSFNGSKMRNFYTFFKVFSRIVVFSQFCGIATGKIPNHCPDVEGCSKCTTEHRRLNGTTPSVYVNALCHFRSGKKLTSIPQKLPSNLGSLSMTSHNVRKLKNSSLENYRYLYKLYLDKNGLESIEAGAFYRQKYLNQLFLSENELVNISRESFQGLKTLEVLRLDHNKLKRISRGTFASMPFLKWVDLRFNRINVLEEGAFDRLDHLEELLLSSNDLRAINGGVFGNLMSLKKVELASNQIQTIDGNAFGCAPLINKLVLGGNQLDKIPREAIRKLRFLELLYVNKNPIKLIESDALIGLQSLTTIDLGDCTISSIQNGCFDYLGNIKTIRLNNNPLNCNCHLRWLWRWLSRKPEVTTDGAICHMPNYTSGNNLTSANLTSFVCSCATCRKDANCSQPINCSCSENWVGLSCSDTCQSKIKAVDTCRSFGGKCFCDKNSTFQPIQKASNCSFNMTSAKCSEHGEIKKVGSHLECVCKTGFKGDGINCTDINECKTPGAAHCSPHSDCVNTPGSHLCNCHKGFENKFNGIMCWDIDECVKQKPCHLHAKCYNNPGRSKILRIS